MVEETMNEYINYLRQIDFSTEVKYYTVNFLTWFDHVVYFQVNSISANIDNILTRMDEFENSMTIVSDKNPRKNIIFFQYRRSKVLWTLIKICR